MVCLPEPRDMAWGTFRIRQACKQKQLGSVSVVEELQYAITVQKNDLTSKMRLLDCYIVLLDVSLLVYLFTWRLQ